MQTDDCKCYNIHPRTTTEWFTFDGQETLIQKQQFEGRKKKNETKRGFVLAEQLSGGCEEKNRE